MMTSLGDQLGNVSFQGHHAIAVCLQTMTATCFAIRAMDPHPGHIYPGSRIESSGVSFVILVVREWE